MPQRDALSTFKPVTAPPPLPRDGPVQVSVALPHESGDLWNRLFGRVTVRFGGRKLVILRAHFPFGIENPDDPRSLVLNMFLPNFTAFTERPSPEGLFGDSVSAVVQARTGNQARLLESFERDRIDSEPLIERHGLRMFRATPNRSQYIPLPREIYFEGDGEITALIQCEPGQRSPHCRHWFNADGFTFNLRYHMTYLPQWRQIQSGVVARLRSFERP